MDEMDAMLMLEGGKEDELKLKLKRLEEEGRK